jgi:hypothetical protein
MLALADGSALRALVLENGGLVGLVSCSRLDIGKDVYCQQHS